MNHHDSGSIGRLLTFWVQISVVLSFPEFQTRIPNGIRVPDPCDGNLFWVGVGHQNKEGGGVRNPFGLDFAANGFKYDATLCDKDSDGDGRKNGEELGDPGCIWTPGSVPRNITGISHPGVCEPMNSQLCQTRNSWLTCSKDFHCPSFSHNTTTNISLTFPHTEVPPVETTLICMGFKLPSDKQYQAVGFTPLINNSLIVHHMVMYGCDIVLPDSMTSSPFACGVMNIPGCQTPMGVVTGPTGICANDEYGFAVGLNGFQYVVVELHWNNPLLMNDQYDSSGFLVSLSTQLRPNNANVVFVTQQFLDIPPLMETFSVTGHCTSACSDLIVPKSVKIAAAHMHMHKLGKSASVYLTRQGQPRELIMDVPFYDYNNQLMLTYDPPLSFNAGDSIQLNCVYNSMTKNTSTHWGDATSDEMCLVILTIYPSIPKFTSCSTWKGVHDCSISGAVSYEQSNCDINTFRTLSNVVSRVCDQSTCSNSSACLVVMKGLQETGCITGEIWEYIQRSRNSAYDLINECEVFASPESPEILPTAGSDGNRCVSRGGLSVVSQGWQPKVLILCNALCIGAMFSYFL